MSVPMKKTSRARPATTPVYDLAAFGKKSSAQPFYIERLSQHLATHTIVHAPHKHDFYLMLYVQTGGGTHTIDFISYTVQPGDWFVMMPGQLHHWNLHADTEGYIMFFQPAFYQLQASGENLMQFPFFGGFHSQPHLPGAGHQRLNLVCADMLSEYRAGAQANMPVLRHYLGVVLHTLSAHPALPAATAIPNKLLKLEQLLTTRYQSLRRPSDYADQLHVSTAHLNALCQQYLGKSISTLIQERQLLEARRLLVYADLSINEVSDQLGFSGPSYFIRFFRQHTGHTPEQFRESVKSAT